MHLTPLQSTAAAPTLRAALQHSLIEHRQRQADGLPAVAADPLVEIGRHLSLVNEHIVATARVALASPLLLSLPPMMKAGAARGWVLPDAAAGAGL